MAEFTCFDNKVAVITGGGGSLGGGSAFEFSKYGASLVLFDNHAGRLDEVKSELLRRGHDPKKLLCILGDVTNEGDVSDLVREATNKFDGINYLVNIVGQKRMGDFETATLEDLDVCLNGNVRGTFIVTKAFLPALLETKGCIVNMSSIAGMRAYHSGLAYGTAKAGLNHMTRIMSASLAKKGVRVNCVCPSTVHSNFNIVSGHCKTEEEMEKYLSVSSRTMPLGRLGTIGEVVKTVLYLCSDSAGFITGAVLQIDGGYIQTLYEPPNVI